MITICPQCQLPLAVTAADLRVAQGQVRCGRCAAVFNALASLYEPGSGSAERRATGGSSAPPAAVSGGATGDGGGGGGSAGAAAGAPAAPPPQSPTTPTTSPADSGSFLTPSPTTGASGLFRAPHRDDEPRFDDTHGADDWPPDAAASLAGEASTAEPPGAADAASAAAAAAPSASASASADEPAAALEGDVDAGEPPDATDTFVREIAAAASEVDFDLGAPPEPEPSPGLAPDRDWALDTMTAAELAALVARSEQDQPPEFASIRIAVDEASEITVLPSESPAVRPAAAGTPADAPQAAASADDATTAGAHPVSEPEPDPSFPQLARAAEDDPDLAGAQLAAEQRRAAMPPGASALRWLELEPAPPAPAPARNEDAAWMPAAGQAPREEPRPGALAAALGLDADLRPLATAPRPADSPVEGNAAAVEEWRAAVPPQSGDDAQAADAVVAELAGDGVGPTAAPRWMWAATIVLGLTLAAQLVHLYREELVAQPALREPLTRVYAALGRPLEPRWELGRYELRQQGVVAEPVAAGTLTVRASIRNGAGRAQPAPLLRVTLQDRFGNRIATRDLTPREYGGAAAIAPAPMLAPGQRIDAEVSLLDPGGEAVGFELDVCLRRPDGAVSCANDAPAING